jgi:magnesium-transporting ATPase (P-type)
VSTLKTPWTHSWQEIAKVLGLSIETGLSNAEVKKRQKKYGLNRLRTRKAKSAWVILVDQVKNFIILLLAVAAGLSFGFGQWLEGCSIVVAIVLNAAIGFFTELRATRSMEALHEISRVTAKVRRDYHVQEVAALELVPGDLVLTEAGDIVTADLRLVEASRLRADESALTGESAPVGKATTPLEEDTPLAELTDMLFKGTAVTAGSGKGVVVATGLNTQLGRISAPSKMTRPPHDPKEPILTSRHWWAIAGYGIVISGAVLTALAFALHWLGMSTKQAVTVSFLSLAFARLWHVFNMRDVGTPLLSNDVTHNPFVWGALALCAASLLAGVYLPGLSVALHTVDPGKSGWLLILGTSLIPLVVGQLWKLSRAA